MHDVVSKISATNQLRLVSGLTGQSFKFIAYEAFNFKVTII